MPKTTDKDSTNVLSRRGSWVRIPLPALLVWVWGCSDFIQEIKSGLNAHKISL